MSVIALLLVAFGFLFANAFLTDLRHRADAKRGLTRSESDKQFNREEPPDWRGY